MALLKPITDKLFDDPTHKDILTGVGRYPVGNNRAIAYTSRNQTMHCMLHGSVIMRVNYINGAPKLISLDTCGYKITTTRQAMNDYIGSLMRAPTAGRVIRLNQISNVSLAKGELSIRYGGVEHVCPDGENLEIWV